MMTFLRQHRRWLMNLSLTLAVAVCASPGAAQDGTATTTPETKRLIRIEEDWVVLIENPDARIASPQILLCLSPDGSFTSDYGLIELNHASQPNWLPGGVQLQGWMGNTNMALFNSPQTDVLERGYDRLVITLAMEVTPDGFTEFSIKNGKSRTWGKFASDGHAKVRVPTHRTDLSAYTREHSVANTHVTHGAHRVRIMYQRRVRYYWDDGTETVDGSYRVLHRYRSLVEEISLEEWEANKEYYNIEITESS